jgi:heat shock protein HslJ
MFRARLHGTRHLSASPRLRSPEPLRYAHLPIAAAVVAAVLLAACGGGANRLTGTAWTLTTVDGHDAIPQAAPWISFVDATRVTGSTGCNSFGGKWKASSSDLSFDEIAATLIGCPGPIGDQEAAFTTALNAVKSYVIENGALQLRDSAGATRLAFRPRTGATSAPAP